MREPKVAPYGSWKSPITSNLIVSETVELGQIAIDGEDVYWIEMRPGEGGRYVVVRRSPDGQTADVTPTPFNVRTRVHEYGGGAFVVADGTVYFSNFPDQRLYRQDPGSEPRPITPQVDLRYADGVCDGNRGRMICVREDHTDAAHEAVNTLVSLNLDGGDGGQVLASRNDFFSSPRLSPDGSCLSRTFRSRVSSMASAAPRTSSARLMLSCTSTQRSSVSSWLTQSRRSPSTIFRITREIFFSLR